jgi:hypothetical protein
MGVELNINNEKDSRGLGNDCHFVSCAGLSTVLSELAYHSCFKGNTEHTKACNYCNNLNRFILSCETAIEGHMLNIMSGGSSSGEKPKIDSNGVCSIPSARVAMYENFT